MVDLARKLTEESFQGASVGRIKGRGAARPHVGSGLLEPTGVATGEDHLGAFQPGAPGGLEPDPCAPTDEYDCLPA